MRNTPTQTQRGREPISCPRSWTIHRPGKIPDSLSWPQARARLRYELSEPLRRVSFSPAITATDLDRSEPRRSGCATCRWPRRISDGLCGRPACFLRRVHFLHRWAIRTLRVQRRYRDVGIGSSLPNLCRGPSRGVQTAWTYSIRLQQRPLPTPNAPYHAQPISSAFGGRHLRTPQDQLTAQP
jgi:hypothetical protein